MAVGGSIESVSIDGRIFPVAADADVNRKLGGFENDIQANGDGSARLVKTRVPWGFDGLVVEVDDSRADHEFLQANANGFGFVAIALTLASGLTYQGTGIVSAELQASTLNATATLAIMGQGTLTQQ